MPLPFLTADPAADDRYRSTTATSYEHHGLWQRPYQLGPWRVGIAALLLLLASFILLSAMVIAFAGSLPGAAGCAVVAIVVIAIALRALRMGVWVSEQGLRQVGLFYTSSLPWRKVAGVRRVQQPVKWLGLPRTVQGQALIISATHGAPLRTQLTDHNADFLGHADAFNRAAHAIEGWAAESR